MLFTRFEILDPSQTAEARRNARSLAIRHGFDEAAAERVAIVVTEAATNILKHAGCGEILLGVSEQSGAASVDVLALDRGPGMSEAACRVDGFSTTGTPGNGLGAMVRMSAQFDLYSAPSRGTVVFARVSNHPRSPSSQIRVHGIQVAKPGEEVCGDQWSAHERRERMVIAVADGLGHGPDASAAARTAVAALYEMGDRSPSELIKRMHETMRHTRGAAVSVVELDAERRVATFSGLGNVSGRILEAGAIGRQMVSINGTAGVEARTFREFSYPWPIGATVILHSDGLSARWDLEEYPGLLTRDPGVIAGVLMRDFCRKTDDATVVVAM